LQAIELTQRISAHFPTTGTNSRKYPAKSHLSGKFGFETGSYLTAHTTISSHQFGELGQSSHSVAQDDIVRCFTAKRMAEEYLRYYERLVGTGSKSLGRSLAPTIVLQE